VAKILIVEDNPDNMKLFSAVLGFRGHAVVGLPGGEALLPTMSQERPEIVLLDIQLPGEDGYQLLAKLRATLGPALPPVVALTAHAMSGDREKALAAGFSGYLTKPIDVSTFGTAVEAFLARG
jgi:two-component system, cell cycle response regulator DivK